MGGVRGRCTMSILSRYALTDGFVVGSPVVRNMVTVITMHSLRNLGLGLDRAAFGWTD